MNPSKNFIPNYDEDDKAMTEFLMVYRKVLYDYGAKATEAMLTQLMDELKNKPLLN